MTERVTTASTCTRAAVTVDITALTARVRTFSSTICAQNRLHALKCLCVYTCNSEVTAELLVVQTTTRATVSRVLVAPVAASWTPSSARATPTTPVPRVIVSTSTLAPRVIVSTLAPRHVVVIFVTAARCATQFKRLVV